MKVGRGNDSHVCWLCLNAQCIVISRLPNSDHVLVVPASKIFNQQAVLRKVSSTYSPMPSCSKLG